MLASLLVSGLVPGLLGLAAAGATAVPAAAAPPAAAPAEAPPAVAPPAVAAPTEAAPPARFVDRGASSAESADTSEISGAQVDEDGLLVRFSSRAVTTGTPIDREAVEVSFAPDEAAQAEDLPVTDVRPVSAETGRQQSVMLVVDTSGSMGEEKIAQATRFAQQFVERLDEEIPVGVATFVDEGAPTQPPVTDRAQVQRALTELPRASSSELYRTVEVAREALPEGGSRRLVVIADGGDDSPRSEQDPQAAAAEAGRALAEDGVALTTVWYTAAAGGQDAADDGSSLSTFTEAAGGRFVDAMRDDQLQSALTDVARSIEAELVIDAELPAELRGTAGTLRVSIETAEEPAVAELRTVLGSAAAPAAAGGTPRVSQPTLPPLPEGSQWLGLLLVGTGLLLVTAVALGATNPAPSRAEERQRSLAAYTMGTPVIASRPATAEPTKLGDNVVTRSAVELAGKLVQGRSTGDRITRSLEAAGIPLRPEEWLVIHGGSALAGGAVLLLASGGNGLALLLGAVFGALTPPAVLSLLRTRRERAFNEQLPDTLTLLASGLRVGYSLPQAIDAVVKEGRNPVKAEFTRALAESRLGMAPEDALQGVADRLRSRDFGWVVLAVRIQRQVGGNLAELLDTVADTIRERSRLRRQVLTLSAEGRLSAWIIAALPVLFTAYLAVVRPEYLRPLYTTGLGVLAISGAVVLFVAGLFGLRWATKVDV